jgi:hypothetical protein
MSALGVKPKVRYRRRQAAVRLAQTRASGRAGLNKIMLMTHRCHNLHMITGRDCESQYRWIGGRTQSRRSKKPPEMISPGASSSLATPLAGNCAYDATCLCYLRCIRGDDDCAAAPRDTPRCACKLSHALRFLDRNSSRAVVSLTCRGCPRGCHDGVLCCIAEWC